MSSEPGEASPAAGPLGPLVVLSGPSGTGKSTLIKRLIVHSVRPLRLSVSATTRMPRPGERDGRDYHFLTREQFLEELAKRGFLEHAVVHGKDYYGTLRREVDPYRQKGWGVILDIDVQGAKQVGELYPEKVSIFLQAPSKKAYEERLRKRATETEESIRRRLASVEHELEAAKEFDYRVVNDDLDTAVEEVRRILDCQFERGTHAG